MASLESWIKIPPYAKPIVRDEGVSNVSQSLVTTPLSTKTSKTTEFPPDRAGGDSRTSLTANLTNAILSATLNVPAPPTPSDPRKTAGRLLSTRDSLSIPITAVNFRRFLSKSGAVFWLQDRVEEVLFWRRGWKVTASWMVAYSFLCYYPRLILLLPHVVLLSILFVTYNVRYPVDANENAGPAPPWKPIEAREGSSEWFANMQAIQNLMGFYVDVYDQVVSVLPHLSHATPTSAPLLSFAVVTLVLSLPLLPLLPLRPIFLVVGLAPFILTHPTTQQLLPPVVAAIQEMHVTTIHRIIDNDRMDDVVWSAPLKEVELWENERWSVGAGSGSGTTDAGWSKSNLKRGERKGWSRRRDGWSDAEALTGSLDGDVRNLTFTLEPGWHFVTTEDWRPDITGSWVARVGADPEGWVYTNDVWNEPRAEVPEEWKQRGATRRRRWTRRIYYTDTKVDT